MKKIKTSLDIDLVKKNIPIYSSQKLCEMIACARYFGMNNEISLYCMEELSKRRLGGESFMFEEIIEKCFQELPPLNLETPDLRTILKGVIK